MDELESRVATALLAREARAPEPREGLAASVLSGADRRRRRRRVSYAALGAAVAAAVAVPMLVGGGLGKNASAPPAAGGGPVTNDGGAGGARDHYTAKLECYSYQHEGGNVPIGQSAVGTDGPRSAIEAWWSSADGLPIEWNSDVVVEQTESAATEVIIRTDQTVAAVVELAKKPNGWHIVGVNACL